MTVLLFSALFQGRSVVSGIKINIFFLFEESNTQMQEMTTQIGA